MRFTLSPEKKTQKILVLECLNDFVGKDFFNSPSRNPEPYSPQTKTLTIDSQNLKAQRHDEDYKEMARNTSYHGR